MRVCSTVCLHLKQPGHKQQRTATSDQAIQQFVFTDSQPWMEQPGQQCQCCLRFLKEGARSKALDLRGWEANPCTDLRNISNDRPQLCSTNHTCIAMHLCTADACAWLILLDPVLCFCVLSCRAVPCCAVLLRDRMSVPRGPCPLHVLKDCWVQGIVDENTLVWGQVRF
jgi:hypothetical protein